MWFFPGFLFLSADQAWLIVPSAHTQKYTNCTGLKSESVCRLLSLSLISWPSRTVLGPPTPLARAAGAGFTWDSNTQQSIAAATQSWKQLILSKFQQYNISCLIACQRGSSSIKVRRRQIRIHWNWDWIGCFEYCVAGTRTHVTHHQFSASLLFWHWYEIMAFYYVKSILTEISASRQEKKQNHQNQISEHMGHATDV